MEMSVGKITGITLKHHQSWGCPVYMLNDWLQSSNLPGLSKWDPCAHEIIYLVHSPLHESSVDLISNNLIWHTSPQYHMVFGDNSFIVTFMKEGPIPPNWAYLVQRSSQEITLEIINLKGTWCTHDLEENPSELINRIFPAQDVQYSTDALILVHFKNLHYFSQPIFSLISHLKMH